MLKKVKEWWLPVVTLVLTVVAALFWVALRVNYSGISKFLGADTNKSFLIMNLPIIVCVGAWVAAMVALLGLLLWQKKKWISFVALGLGVVMTVGAMVVVYYGAKDYLRFIMVHFWRSLAVAACIAAFALVLFCPVKGKKLWKAGALAVVILVAVVMGYGLRPCEFTYGAVVYAVEDEYQIVFSTSDSAIAWVQVGEESYYDLYAGSMRSADRVHKITVPQSVLDAAGGYTVCAQQMIYRGPFGGYKGEIISQEYDFFSVDPSDGVDYYAISDVHEAVNAAAAACREKTDFIVLVGDLISMVETEADAQLANELAHKITGGTIPVVYARGNHEIKGEYGEVLYKYVGSKHQEFYYWFTLGDQVGGVVLDIGEDHEDDWWEYYGTAQFCQYRDSQSELLRELIEEGTLDHCAYRMAVCHIPVFYVGNGYFEEHRLEWTDLLNELEMDISLSGHKHTLWAVVPGMYEPGQTLRYNASYTGTKERDEGGYLTQFQFPSFLVGRRSLTQQGGTQKDGSTDYTCLRVKVDLEAGTQTASFVNSQGQTLSAHYPFVGNEDAFTELTLELN